MEMAWCDQNYALTDLVTEGVIEGEMKRPGLIKTMPYWYGDRGGDKGWDGEAWLDQDYALTDLVAEGVIEGEMEMAWRDQDYALTDLVAEGVIEGEMERA